MDLKTKMVMSIIVPCLNEEEVLPLFYQALEALLPDLETESSTSLSMMDQVMGP